jgi:CBS domain-containing protein
MNLTGNINSIITQKSAHPLWTIAPEATVFDAISMMADKNIGALLVMRGSELAGVFSERDYTRKIALKGKSSKQTSVGEVLSAPTVTVSPEHTVEECMRLMTEHRVRHLPVLDQGKVAGIVSIGDLVNWIISEQHTTIKQMEDYISGKYPG